MVSDFLESITAFGMGCWGVPKFLESIAAFGLDTEAAVSDLFLQPKSNKPKKNKIEMFVFISLECVKFNLLNIACLTLKLKCKIKQIAHK